MSAVSQEEFSVLKFSLVAGCSNRIFGINILIKLNYCIIHLFISGGQYHLLIFLQYCILLFSLFCCLISVSTVKFNNNNNNNNNNARPRPLIITIKHVATCA